MDAFSRHGKPDYLEYTRQLLADLDEQIRGWETVEEDYLPLLEGNYHD
jgi:hypothetical protein